MTRRVSFSQGTTPESATKGKNTTSKSSLKPNAASDLPPVPAHLYTHPDPLIRRLRLRDSSGNQVNLQREFQDTQVVGFLFGTTWQASERSFYMDVSEMARHKPHKFKLIYVSIDPNYDTYLANTKDRGWLSMEWNDGSSTEQLIEDNAPNSSSGAIEPGDIEEDFIHGTDPHAEAIATLPPNVYTRPFSRIHLASTTGILTVPTLAIYHLPTSKWIEAYVRPRDLRSEKRDATFEAWSKGEGSTLTTSEIFFQLRWTLACATFAIIYAITVYFYGAEYDFIGKFLHENLGEAFAK